MLQGTEAADRIVVDREELEAEPTHRTARVGRLGNRVQVADGVAVQVDQPQVRRVLGALQVSDPGVIGFEPRDGVQVAGIKRQVPQRRVAIGLGHRNVELGGQRGRKLHVRYVDHEVDRSGLLAAVVRGDQCRRLVLERLVIIAVEDFDGFGDEGVVAAAAEQAVQMRAADQDIVTVTAVEQVAVGGWMGGTLLGGDDLQGRQITRAAVEWIEQVDEIRSGCQAAGVDHRHRLAKSTTLRVVEIQQIAVPTSDLDFQPGLAAECRPLDWQGQ